MIKNGVDVPFFNQNRQEEKYDLVFVGNMSYPPNIQAAKYISEKILPLLLSDFPQIKILIAGASPSQVVRNLASKHIAISGWIDDFWRFFITKTKSCEVRIRRINYA